MKKVAYVVYLECESRRQHLTTYHPICNGLTEKFSGTLKKMLKRLCTEQPKQWNRYINPLLFAYREVPQDSTKFAPLELMYGRSLRGPLNILRDLWTDEIKEPDVKSSYQYVFELRERLEETWKIVHEELGKAHKKQKFYYDKKAKVRKLEVGDNVLVLLPTDSNKLLMQWKGPYEIVSATGPNDYRVKMGESEKTLHVNMLKKYLTREPSGETSTAKNDDRVIDARPTTSCGSVNFVCTDDVNLADTYLVDVFNNDYPQSQSIVDISNIYSVPPSSNVGIGSFPVSSSAQHASFAVVQDFESGEEVTTTEDMTDLGSWGQRETVDDIQFGDQLSSE